MAAKRFQPILNEIPEEETYPSGRNSIDFYQGFGSQKSGSIVSLKRENSRKRTGNCIGCPGCKDENNTELQNIIRNDIPTCDNCIKNNKGDKQNSIRKWLENIPTNKQTLINNDTFATTKHNTNLMNSLLSSPSTNNKTKVKKQNSFNLSNLYPIYNTDNIKERNYSTSSVKSEPLLRRNRLPIVEIDKVSCYHNNFKYYGQTVSRIDDIKPIGLGDYRPGSCRINPLINQKKNKFITNKNILPDMVNEAIALEHGAKSYSQSSSDEEKYNRINNTLNKNTILKNISESPPANDYETDSLERLSQKKETSMPSEYVDVSSSQPSPSLSNALPLEEELTMQNDIYKRNSSNSDTPSPIRYNRENHNHYETIAENSISKEYKEKANTLSIKKANNYSLVSEVYVNNNYNFGSTPTSPSGSECSMGSRKNLSIIQSELPEKPGCLTIEVKDSPENYIKIHESDSFEPDTLDRKYSKCKNKEPTDQVQFSRKYVLNNINNEQNIQLRSSGTFKKVNAFVSNNNEAKFCSLRITDEHRSNIFSHPNLYQPICNSRSVEDNFRETNDDCKFDWDSEEGRILTLELRHSKRQRQSTPPSGKQIKHLARPDILPPLPPTDEIPIYEQPTYPPRRVNTLQMKQSIPKNENGRSLSPKIHNNNMEIEKLDNLNEYNTSIDHYRSPMRASVKTRKSDCGNINILENNKHYKTSNRQKSNKLGKQISSSINTSTYVKAKDDVNTKCRYRRRKGFAIEDSGYLSSDSTSSRQTQRKVVPHVVSCSDSDDTENEARSESGAESIETHSVFFGSFRKIKSPEVDNFHRTTTDEFTRKSSKRTKTKT